MRGKKCTYVTLEKERRDKPALDSPALFHHTVNTNA